jgi:hypothetical protein
MPTLPVSDIRGLRDIHDIVSAGAAARGNDAQLATVGIEPGSRSIHPKKYRLTWRSHR